ncbi:MAG TPA: YceH family protein [Acidimicrobiales bacterium]|nr:YceH family protein [Acidimicrobiales bacterium]
MDLSAAELRVLGSLVEKQLTTPQQYPLTLNALSLACNQSSNRDPVVAYDEPTVEAAVTSIKTKGLVSFVHPSHGRSVLRYRHTLEEAWGLGVRPLALLSVLVLRGAQTPGELRARTERMVQFAGIDEVEAELEALAGRATPLVERRPRLPGQKEDRYVHLLGAFGDLGAEPTDVGARPDAGDPDAPFQSPGVDAPISASLADDVASLRAEVAALRRDLDDLRAQLGA